VVEVVLVYIHLLHMAAQVVPIPVMVEVTVDRVALVIPMLAVEVVLVDILVMVVLVGWAH
jgi:hypothetical protein